MIYFRCTKILLILPIVALLSVKTFATLLAHVSGSLQNKRKTIKLSLFHKFIYKFVKFVIHTFSCTAFTCSSRGSRPVNFLSQYVHCLNCFFDPVGLNFSWWTSSPCVYFLCMVKYRLFWKLSPHFSHT